MFIKILCSIQVLQKLDTHSIQLTAVTLCINSRKKFILLHRLILRTYIFPLKDCPWPPERVLIQKEHYHNLLSPSAQPDIVKYHHSCSHFRGNMQFGFQGA